MLAFVTTALVALAHAQAALAAPAAKADASCFPLGASFNGDSTDPPAASRDQWWCDQSQLYGFLGFSYPLENSNCDDASNSYDKITADFANMKSEFGASMVRIYAPQCRDQSIWQTLLQAGIDNDMAVIPQIWWGFDSNQNEWKQSRAALLAVIQDNVVVAPFVFHSVEFGSEPIGDSVDGGYDNFISDLKKFKTSLAPYNIPVTISEDWDRPGILSEGGGVGQGTSLAETGQEIADVIDQVHAHIMPYYHADIFPTAANVLPYFQWYIPFLANNLPGKPIFVSETMWASYEGGSHDRGFGNPGENIGNFTQYWNTIGGRSACQLFKQYQAGWFVHTYDDSQEDGLGMLDSSGNPKMNFKPVRC